MLETVIVIVWQKRYLFLSLLWTGMDGRATVVGALSSQQYDRDHCRSKEALETGTSSHQRVSTSLRSTSRILL